jgi:cyanophycin synthetase
MGYPLVIKPNDKDRGEGVAADLVQESDVVAAYQEARQWSEQVLIEKHQVGFTHRFTVVHNKVMRVAKHVAFGVVGDGVCSVEQLVATNALRIEEKKRVRRNMTANTALDGEALGLLQQYGLSKDAIPAAGQYVKLRRKDNVSAGGTRHTLDVAAQVHPDNVELALNAVRLIGLDFAGLDLITPDVGRSWRELPVTICEINGNPQLVARDDPNMYKRVLAHVMPEPVRVQANLVVFQAKPSQAQLQRLIQTFSPEASFAGVSTDTGLWVNGQMCAGPFGSSYAAALALIVQSHIKKLTFAMSLDEVLKFGLPLGQIDRLLLPWKDMEEVPMTMKKNYQELMRMVSPHAAKTLYAKGT